MSNHRDQNLRPKRNEHSLKTLPTDVLLKARSTLVSLSGVLKSRQHEQQQKIKYSKPDAKEKTKTKTERLKNSKSEPEFNNMQKSRRRSRIDDKTSREYDIRPRPLSVGSRRQDYEDEMETFHLSSYTNGKLNNHKEMYDSAEEVFVQSRLVIPFANDRLSGTDIQTQECDRPRKKLSFREPEIESGSNTLGRSSKLMGVNSLVRRPQRISLPEKTSKGPEGMDSDLEVTLIMIYFLTFSKISR